MDLQERYDDAMFDFSRGEFARAIGGLRAVLAADPAYFDAQLALGMAHYRTGDFAAAIATSPEPDPRSRTLRPATHFGLSRTKRARARPPPQ